MYWTYSRNDHYTHEFNLQKMLKHATSPHPVNGHMDKRITLISFNGHLANND